MMDGQMNIFDMNGSGRPCEYSFHRYIGQKVHVMEMIGTITEIGPYYTFVHDEANHRILAGTPTTCWPVEEENDGMDKH